MNVEFEIPTHNISKIKLVEIVALVTPIALITARKLNQERQKIIQDRQLIEASFSDIIIDDSLNSGDSGIIFSQET